MDYLNINNEKIAYAQMGNKESKNTYVFIHGATMTSEAMIPLAVNFPDVNAIAVDLPGHGGSTGATKTSIEDFADCIDLFLQEMLRNKLVSDHITLIGYSLGGAIAYELALKKRKEYKRMIILSSGANISNNAPLMNAMKDMPLDMFDMAEFFKHAFGSGTTEEQMSFIVEMLMKTKIDDSIGFSDLLTSTKYNRIDKAGEISIPTLIFAGDEDEIILPTCEIELWTKLQNASLAIVPFRGHTAIFEELEYLVSLINNFCRIHQ